MANLWNFLIVAILIVIYFTTSIISIFAAADLHGYRKLDDYLMAAWEYNTSNAIIAGFLVFIFIVIIVLVIASGVVLFSTGVGEVAVGAEVVADVGVATVAGGIETAEVVGTAAEGVASAAGEAAEASSELFETGEDIYKTGKKGSKALKHGKKRKKEKIGWWTMPFLLITMGLVIFTGVLAAKAAFDIAKSPNYKTNDDKANKKISKAYYYSIASAVLCLGSSGIIVIIITLDIIYR